MLNNRFCLSALAVLLAGCLGGCKSVNEMAVTDGSVILPETSVTADDMENIISDTEVYTNSVTTVPSVSYKPEMQSESPSEIFTDKIMTVGTSETLAAAQPSAASYGTNSYKALNYDIQKGVWVSYLEYTSFMECKTEKQFRTAVGKCFDNVSSLGFNTVYVHARANGDAYYNSELFPAGDRYDGCIDTKPDYDALQIMIEEAHSRSLSIHAWVNPMRLMTDAQMRKISDSYKIKQWYNSSSKKGKYIVKINNKWYLNPAYTSVTQLIADGISEIVANYDVDGVQIDDYFYPTTNASFDKSAYKASKTTKSLSDWRIARVNSMVKKLCKAVHSANSTAVFGISPQGSVENDYDEVYADVKNWCQSSAYCDYILPQVYYGYENSLLPYDKTIAQWSEMTRGSDVKLVIGLAAYKVGLADNYAGAKGKNEWLNNSDILSRQLYDASRLNNYGGAALFRYGSLFEPDKCVSAQVKKELANIKK